MLMVSRLDRAQDMDRGNIRAGEGAIVDDFLDAGATGSDLGGEISQSAGTIADHRGEATEPAISHQGALDDPTQHIRIDIAPAKKEHDAFAGQFRELAGKASR